MGVGVSMWQSSLIGRALHLSYMGVDSFNYTLQSVHVHSVNKPISLPMHSALV